MTQFFNVQMNLQDAPQIQNEQPKTFSSSPGGDLENGNFASVLQKALPNENTVKENTISNQQAPEALDSGTFKSALKETTVTDNGVNNPFTAGASEGGRAVLIHSLATKNTVKENRFSNQQDAKVFENGSTQSPPQEKTVIENKVSNQLAAGALEDETIGSVFNNSLPNKNEAIEKNPLNADALAQRTLESPLIKDLPNNNRVVEKGSDNQQIAAVAKQEPEPISQFNNNPLPKTLTNLSAEAISEDSPTLNTHLTRGVNYDALPDTQNLPSGNSPNFGVDEAQGLVGNITSRPISSLNQQGIPSLTPENTALQQNIPQSSDARSGGFADGIRSLAELQALMNGNKNSADLNIRQEPVVFPGEARVIQTVTPEQDAFLQRIQSFINSGAEAGTLSIQKVKSTENELFLRSQLPQLQQSSVNVQNTQTATGKVTIENSAAFTPLEEGVFGPSLRNEQQELRGIRHDSNQQFYNAKVQPQNVLSENANSSTNQQGDSLGQQNNGFSQLATTTPATEPGTTFSLQSGVVTDPLNTQLPGEVKPTVLPSGTLIHDQDVIQQLVERFRLNRGQIESKIQMKLHPVELGKMEIDLTVKEGSIRANVVAQSQHVQEILERNLTKLRSVLEQQGFTIDEISITSQSEMVGEFDLFDQQLSNSDSSSSDNKSKSSDEQSTFFSDELQPSFLDAESVVNVKA